MYAVENLYEETDEFKISDQDLMAAVSALRFRATVHATAKLKKSLTRTRERIERKRTLAIEEKINSFNKMEAITENPNVEEPEK